MRILHWYPGFLGGGGVANAVHGLATAQSTFGEEVFIAAATPLGNPLYEGMSAEGVTLLKWTPQRCFRLGNSVLRWLAPNTVRLFKELRPNIVHIHGEFNLDNLWPGRLFKVPMILSPQGAFHPGNLSKPPKLPRTLYIVVVKYFLYSRMAALHACSFNEEQGINEKLANAKVYTVPNGANTRTQIIRNPSFPGSSPHSDQRQGIKCLSVGRLDVYHKGLDNLLAGFAEAAKKVNAPKLFLTLVGPDWGGSKTWLEDRANKLGIGDRVTFTGSLSGEAVAKELDTHDIYIQLSRYEGFSLSIVEALLARKICILSHATGIASILKLALFPHIRLVTGEVEDTASTIVDVCRKLPELRKAAEEAHEPLIRFFSWKRIAKLHLETYAKLLGETPARNRCGYVQ